MLSALSEVEPDKRAVSRRCYWKQHDSVTRTRRHQQLRSEAAKHLGTVLVVIARSISSESGSRLPHFPAPTEGTCLSAHSPLVHLKISMWTEPKICVSSALCEIIQEEGCSCDH